MNEVTQAFLTDLKAVLQKHGVRIERSENYDGRDRYCGTDISFESGDWTNREAPRVSVEAKDLEKLLSQIR